MRALFSLYMLGMLVLWPSMALADTTRGLHQVRVERRTALVIGNGAYKTLPLHNPVNDARDIARVLRERRFQVALLLNANRRQMIQAMNRFGRALKKGGVGLFYYAGHGMQVQGRNYLLPIGARIDVEGDIEFEAVDAGRVLGRMDAAGNRLNMMILDACRDNPFARSFRSSTQGLARMDAPAGTLIAYATAPGRVARDGDEKNGVYTTHLLKQIQVPGQELSQMFKKVRAAVRSGTDGKQIPWEATSLEGNFYFTPGASRQATTSSAATVASRPPGSPAEREMWKLVKDSKDVTDFDAFLTAFPLGEYAMVARLQLKRLRADQTPDTLRSKTAATSAPRGSSAEREMWHLIKDSKDVTDFNAFLTAFPQGEYAAVARLQLKRLGPAAANVLTERKGFVLVPPGRFQMGSHNGNSNEQYVHTVEITRPFYISDHEVTVGEYIKFVSATPHPAPQCGKGKRWPTSGRDHYAVTCVSWNDAQAYVSWLNKDMPERNFRLCTEAEWEYAAKAGTATKWSCGDHASCLDKANPHRSSQRSHGNSPGLPPIKTKPPNPWKLYDMHGSVWEWVEDYYSPYYAKEAVSNPTGVPKGAYRVQRGGGFKSPPFVRRSSSRDYVSPQAHLPDLGFRLCSSQ